MLKNLRILNILFSLICFVVIIIFMLKTINKIETLNRFSNFDFANINKELKSYLFNNYTINNYDILNLDIQEMNLYKTTIQSSEWEDVKFDITKEKELIVDNYKDNVLSKQNTINRQVAEIQNKLYYMLHDFNYGYEDSDLEKINYNLVPLTNKYLISVYCISPDNVNINSYVDYSNYGLAIEIIHSEKNREKNYEYDSIIKYIKAIALNFKYKNFSVAKFNFTFRNFHSLENVYVGIELGLVMDNRYYLKGKFNNIYIENLTLEQISNNNFYEYFKDTVQITDNIDIDNVYEIW